MDGLMSYESNVNCYIIICPCHLISSTRNVCLASKFYGKKCSRVEETLWHSVVGLNAEINITRETKLVWQVRHDDIVLFYEARQHPRRRLHSLAPLCWRPANVGMVYGQQEYNTSVESRAKLWLKPKHSPTDGAQCRWPQSNICYGLPVFPLSYSSLVS